MKTLFVKGANESSREGVQSRKIGDTMIEGRNVKGVPQREFVSFIDMDKNQRKRLNHI